MTNIINATNRFRNKERKFWKDFSAVDVAKALSGVLTINEFLALNHENTTAGKPQAFNPDF